MTEGALINVGMAELFYALPMVFKSIVAGRRKRIALIAHDNLKPAIACNRATADFLLSSPLMGEGYERRLPDLEGLLD